MKSISEALKDLGFSAHEVGVYLFLLENPGKTVYQIAKELSLSRSTAYPIVEKLASEGILLAEAGEKEIYHAEEPKTMLSRIQSGLVQSIEFLRKELPDTPIKPERERFINVIGEDAVIAKTKAILQSAEKEVFLNTDLDLAVFQTEMSSLAKKSIRVIAFSFADQPHALSTVELYSRHLPSFGNSRIMVVVDMKTTLIANCHPLRHEWAGTVTDNQLMAQITAEHIHHDIYLLKIAEKLGKDLLQDNADVLLGSLIERGL